MVAIYEALGVPSAVTVVVILGYRLLSFWLPVELGFPVDQETPEDAHAGDSPLFKAPFGYC